jgi:hypothetical protein
LLPVHPTSPSSSLHFNPSRIVTRDPKRSPSFLTPPCTISNSLLEPWVKKKNHSYSSTLLRVPSVLLLFKRPQQPQHSAPLYPLSKQRKKEKKERQQTMQ